MKKFIALALGGMLAISGLAGCGSRSSRGNYAAKVRIGYWKAGYGTEFMEYWTSEYNKAHPDEQLDFDIDPAVGASAIGSSLENSAGLCDVYLSLATDWSSWALQGWIEPLDDLMEANNDDGVKLKDAFTYGLEDFGALNGHQYVLAQSGAGGNGIVYSQKMFDDHGWEVPKTVSELKALIEQINNDPVNKDSDKSNDIAPFSCGGQVMAYWNAVVQLWANQYDGVENVTDFYKNPTLEKYKPENRQGAMKALKLFEELVCTGEGTLQNCVPQAMSKNHILMQNEFVQGHAAMISGIYGVVNETKKILPKDFDMRVFFPAIDGAETDENGNPLLITAANEFDFMFIPKASSVKEYAKKFLLWISTQKMAAAYLQYTASFPPFEFNPDDIQNKSSLLQSQLEMKDSLRVVMGVTDNPLTKAGKITFWPAGEPYSAMVLENKTAEQAMQAQYNWAAANWNDWCSQAGLK